MNDGLFEANLGSGLYKKRIASPGRGKRGGFRTLLAFRSEIIAFFVYGFKKNEKADLTIKERQIYRDIAHDFLSMTTKQINQMIKNKLLFEVK